MLNHEQNAAQVASKHNPVDLYHSLVHCAIRGGRFNLVERFLDDMVNQAKGAGISNIMGIRSLEYLYNTV